MTQRYKNLLFDADNTLLDFKKTEAHALKLAFKHFGLHLTPEIKALYDEINHGLWQDFEDGLIDKDTVVTTRFHLLFTELGLDVNSHAFEAYYQPALGAGAFLIPGAKALCERLAEAFDLYIVTNGVSATQYSRLSATGLDAIVKGIFVSEDLGSQKPQRAYFDQVFGRIPNFSKDSALIIGDSLSSDIAGGSRAGIDTCWYNPQGLPLSGNIQPTYTINTLKALLDIL
ncbi:MAG: YjjG family noncanonical pyrimidine nucleotidase [Eubacterium sp.]|nr:YjjG family noncanonical pyrimidine nucleotidase [Eubacterium sp.]